ncbi:hypothetical protein HMPREF9237_00060 [Actinotignum schaalii FB123-CNA-2]|uniref:Uncharacterized protein n=1 Tax=Actinotignum schaalii FB123-CNA-2 TaxID=883067 RepID=S2WKX6_9ACTO|nr:hypothetical protein HMPREF9237_00060 [Actinotignum schaalii FB123-CNA-2]
MCFPRCTSFVVHAKYTSEKTPLPRRRLGPIRLGRPALRACVSGVVVLENIGPDRVVLHDRKSGVGCSSSTTLCVGKGVGPVVEWSITRPTVAPLPGAAAKELVRGPRRGGYFKRLLEVLR